VIGGSQFGAQIWLLVSGDQCNSLVLT
jgi:hypothetical protein